MVTGGLTDYLALSGELANSSDVEVLVNGVSMGKRHYGPGDSFTLPWRIRVSAAQAGSGGHVTVRKSGDGITYWAAEDNWYSDDRRAFQQEKLSPHHPRLLRASEAATEARGPHHLRPGPLKGAVHVGDVVAVRLAVNGSDWKYLLARIRFQQAPSFCPARASIS